MVCVWHHHFVKESGHNGAEALYQTDTRSLEPCVLWYRTYLARPFRAIQSVSPIVARDVRFWRSRLDAVQELRSRCGGAHVLGVSLTPSACLPPPCLSAPVGPCTHPQHRMVSHVSTQYLSHCPSSISIHPTVTSVRMYQCVNVWIDWIEFRIVPLSSWSRPQERWCPNGKGRGLLGVGDVRRKNEYFQGDELP